MKKTNKFDFKTLLVVILSLCLTLSLSFAACKTNDENSSSSSSSKEAEHYYPTDGQKTIPNGDFEFSTFEKEKAKDYPVSTSMNWIRSNDSITTSSRPSSFNSGIIDTEDEFYNEIAQNSNAGFHALKDENGEDKKDENGNILEYYNPHTPEYYGLIDKDDLFARPSEDDIKDKTEASENKDGLPMSGSKILMIHNEIKDDKDHRGTAQMFSGPSFTVNKGEYAEVSVWVSTHDLKSANQTANENGFGAYIAIQNTVKNTQPEFVVKNIDTHDSWVKYTFYLKASDIANSSYKIVLGLGNGSSKKMEDYVEGFAYFDNVTFKTITAEEYNNYTAGNPEIADSDPDDYTYNIFTNDGETDKEHLIRDEHNATYADTTQYTKPEDDSVNYSTEVKVKLSHVRPDREPYDTDNFFNGGEMTERTYLSKTNENDIYKEVNGDINTAINTINGKNPKITIDEEISFAGNAIAFYAKNPTGCTYTTQEFSLDKDDYIVINFWVTADLLTNNGKGLTVTLNDLGYGNNEAKKTTIIDNLKSTYNKENDKDENKKDKNDWKEYSILVSNTADNTKVDDNDETRKFTFTFDFGPENADADLFSQVSGYAIIAGFDAKHLSEDDYNISSISNNIHLTADLPNGEADDEEIKKDQYSFSYGKSYDVRIQNEVASWIDGYTLRKGGTKAVGGTVDNNFTDDDKSNVVAGLINTKYSDNYVAKGILTQDEADAISSLPALTPNEDKENHYLQPIIIKNKTAGSYGYVGSNATFTSHSTTLVSFKVKVIGDAHAYFYLTSPDPRAKFKVIALEADGYDNNKNIHIDEVKKELSIDLTANDTNDGWFTVKFLVTAGDNDIEYRPEFWNGSRDGNNENKSNGLVLIDDYKVESNIDIDYFNHENEDKAKEETKYTRFYDTITTIDKKGKKSIDYKYYDKEKDEKVVFTTFNDKSTIIADYTIIDVSHEQTIDLRDEAQKAKDEEEPKEKTDEEKQKDFNASLQISSIIIAIVLILLLIVVLIRVLVKKYGKKKAATVSYYNRDSRDETAKKVISDKSKKANKAKDDETENTEEATDETVEEPEEVKPYDYDNPENNIENDEMVESEENVGNAEENVEEDNAETTENNDDNGDGNN